MISKNIKVPSVAKIGKLYDVDKEQAKAMRAVMLAYAPMCNNGAMEILNVMYKTHGVESFTMKHQNGRKYEIIYLNTGDSYGVTILYIVPFVGMPFYDIASWGDWAEKEKTDEREGK